MSDEAMRQLITPPEVVDELERIELVQLAHELYVAPEAIREKLPDLEAVNTLTADGSSKQFYAGFFKTAIGQEELSRLGVQGTTDGQTIYSQLCGLIANNQVSAEPKVRTAVASASRKWYVGELAKQVTADEPSEAWLDGPVLHLNFAPDKLLTKLEALQAYRSHYREVSQRLREAGDQAEHMQQLLGIHWARVNYMMASLYPGVLNLAEQLSQSPDTELTRDWQQRLMAAAPLVRQLYGEDKASRSEQKDDFLRRLDLLRNGAEESGGPNFSSISQADLRLAAELETEAGEQALSDVAPLPEAIVGELASTTWDKDDLGGLAGAVLGSWGLLSSEPLVDNEVLSKRKGPAEDGKWQIVVRTSTETLSIDGRKKVVIVPDSYSRSGTESLALVGHELTHVLQDEADTALAKAVPLAEVGGRRKLTGREMGGIYEERRIYAMCGQTRSTNTAYLRALEAKEQGGDQVAAARAFYGAFVRGTSAEGQPVVPAIARRAADRALRLYRNGGHNSQPLDYLEQELLLRSMANWDQSTVRATVTATTSFSFRDAATLHRLGLLDIPTQAEHQPAEEVVALYLGRRDAGIVPGVSTEH
jgi:hypothetical protein